MTSKKVLSTPVNKQTLAEQMADRIANLIISGQLESKETLPTEPELSIQFGVSRAVVRDATRILMAKGLVDVQHGRGVYVTEPTNAAFGDALLLALQRAKASVWDVEQFELLLFPEILAMAAEFANEENIKELELKSNNYLKFFESYQKDWWGQEIPDQETKKLTSLYRNFIQELFSSTRNKVIEQLALPLLRLRNIREWNDANLSAENFIEFENEFIESLLAAVKKRDPEEARKLAQKIMALPTEAIESMMNTPVGNVAVIDINFGDHLKNKKQKE